VPFGEFESREHKKRQVILTLGRTTLWRRIGGCRPASSNFPNRETERMHVHPSQPSGLRFGENRFGKLS